MPSMANAHALLVGIADYQHCRTLPAAVIKDVEDIQSVLVSEQLCAYPPGNVRPLLNEQATQAALRTELKDLKQRTDADSVVFIYFSGHGARVESGPAAGEYIVPVDADLDWSATPPQLAVGTAISGAELTAALAEIPARKLVVVFDCCYAGGVADTKGGLAPTLKGGLSEAYYTQLAEGRGRVILSSSRDTEESNIMPGGSNSLFTQHLLAGLRGGIGSDDGFINIFDLFEYIQPRVTNDCAVQHPIFISRLETNFPIALRLGGQKGNLPDAGQGFRYDAYVSFVDQGPDRKWVRETLLPRLRQAGVSVVISRDVEEPGVSRLVSRERGMAQAKRTVVVLSQAYLADNWTTTENIIVQDRGIRQGQYPLLPVLIEPLDEGQLPDRLAFMVTLDFTDHELEEEEFARLVRSLRGPLPHM
jgi:hypothetical protein